MYFQPNQSIDFRCIFIADKREKSFIINDIETFKCVHGIKHILFIDFIELCDFIKNWIPLFSGNESIVIDINGSKNVIKTDFLFNRSFSKTIEQIGESELIDWWHLFGLNTDFVCFQVFLWDETIFININFLYMW